MSYSATHTEAVCSVIQGEFSHLRHAAKLLARITGASCRSAENWLAGKCAPAGDHLLKLQASIPRLRVMMNERIDALAAANDAIMAKQDARAAALRARR